MSSDMSEHLLSLEEQMDRLRHLNATVWDKCFSKRKLDSICTESAHKQSVDDLEILHADCGNPHDTLELHWAAIAATQPKFYHPRYIQADQLKLLADRSLVWEYVHGIHIVHIDLTAHWKAGKARSVKTVRKQVASGTVLAHGEVLSAFSLHRELFHQMDGVNFPYMDLAGYDLKVSGSFEIPFLWWGSRGREAKLGSSLSRRITSHYAAPVVLEKEQ